MIIGVFLIPMMSVYYPKHEPGQYFRNMILVCNNVINEKYNFEQISYQLIYQRIVILL